MNATYCTAEQSIPASVLVLRDVSTGSSFLQKHVWITISNVKLFPQKETILTVHHPASIRGNYLFIDLLSMSILFSYFSETTFKTAISFTKFLTNALQVASTFFAIHFPKQQF